MDVTIGVSGYNLFLGKNSIQELNSMLVANAYSKCFIVCDSNTLDNCLPLLIENCEMLQSAEIIEIEPGEENKTLEIYAQIMQTLIDNHADRRSVMVNLGGGMITDLGGFAACTYMRGIDFIQVPTSLLGMVDASVGAKVGIDFGGLKNIIGSFAKPKAVIINTIFLESLDNREYIAGIAEVIKIALMRDKKFANELIDQLLDDDLELSNTQIRKSIELKADIVNEDFDEKGARKLLNFGHTLGHAIESHLLNSPNPLKHGEAVGIGMFLETRLSQQKIELSNADSQRIYPVLQQNYPVIKFTDQDIESIITLCYHDKKNESGNINCTLLKSIGLGEINQIVEEQEITEAINFYNTYNSNHAAHKSD